MNALDGTELNSHTIFPMVPTTFRDEQDRARYAHALDGYVTGARSELSVREQQLGMALHTIRERRLYEDLGHASFESYLASHGLAKSTAYRYVQQAEVYLVPEEPPATPGELAEMGLMRSLAIAGEVKGKNREEAAGIVAEAKTLSYGDLQARLEERRGGVSDPIDEFLAGCRSRLEQWSAQLRPPLLDDPEVMLGTIKLETTAWYERYLALKVHREAEDGRARGARFREEHGLPPAVRRWPERPDR